MGERVHPVPSSSSARLACALATVCGIGQFPWAPGTWGSLAGLFLGMMIARLLNPSCVWAALLLALTLPVCAVVCTAAEQALDQHDAPAIILDEVWAMASIVMMLPWTLSSWRSLVAVFLLFRLFDIIKPWPLKRLAQLSGGWGVMMDDVGAAGYAMSILWVIRRLFHM